MNATHRLAPESRLMNRSSHTPGTSMSDKRLSPGSLLAGLFVFLFLALFQVQALAVAPAFESVEDNLQTDKDIDSLIIDMPANVSGATGAGDLLLATIASYKNALTVQAPSGWTRIEQGQNAGQVTVAAFYKFDDGSETGPYTFTQDPAGEEMAGAIARYTGVDPITPIDLSGAQNSVGNTQTPTAPCVTTSFADTRVVRIIGQAQGKNGTTPPTGNVERVDINIDNKILLSVADKEQDTRGPTGPAAFSVTENKPARGLTIALVPVGGIPNDGEGAVSYGSGQTNTELEANVDSISLEKPIGTAEGDLLLASIATNKNGTTITAPAGWIPLDQGQFDDNVTLAVFYKLAGAGEVGPYVFSTGVDGAEKAGSIERYTGVDQNTPFDISAGAGNKGTTPTAPAVTTGYTNTRVVRIFAQAQDLGFDKYINVPCTVERAAVSANDKVILGVSDLTQAASGTTGTGVFNTDYDKDWRAVTVVLVPEQVRFEIDKTTSTPTIDAGGQASYSVTVTNIGFVTATDVEVNDQLPTGFSYASSTVTTGSGATRTSTVDPTGGTSAPAWGLWEIDAGASVTIDYTADVAASTIGGVYSNSAAVVSNEAEAFIDSVDVTVRDADLAVTKTVDNPYPNEGDTVVFTVTATNNGAAAATNVTVSDSLPAGLTLVSAVASPGTCTGTSCSHRRPGQRRQRHGDHHRDRQRVARRQRAAAQHRQRHRRSERPRCRQRQRLGGRDLLPGRQHPQRGHGDLERVGDQPGQQLRSHLYRR